MVGEIVLKAENSGNISTLVNLKDVGFIDRARLLRSFAKGLEMDIEDIAIATTLFPYLDYTTKDTPNNEKEEEAECKCDCEKQDGENEVEEDLGNGHTITIKVT